MKTLVLKRVWTGEHGTFGVLIYNYPIALTCEDPWKNNEKGVSCIPRGTYIVKRCSHSEEYEFRPSARYGDIFNVTNVVGRTFILIHRGNLPKDTEGCILLGEEYGHLNGKPAILDSGKAFKEVMTLLRDENEFELRIMESYGGGRKKRKR